MVGTEEKGAEEAQPRETSQLLFREENSENFASVLRLQRVMLSTESKYQTIQVIDTCQFGKTLIMDGKTQSAAFDEYVYHEALVQPAMLSHPSPKKVFIGGGGELATAREVLRHKCVEKVVMVDLDEVAVNVCIKELPEWNNGCVNDPRLEIIFGDAIASLEKYDGTFDVIILDVCDPIEAGPAYLVYTKEFYEMAKSKLTDNGVLITQSGACSLYNFQECFTAIHNTLKQSFHDVVGYNVNIPSFVGDWGFNLAFKNADESEGNANRLKDSAILDAEIEERLGSNTLRFYDGISHRGMFSLSKPIRKGMAQEDRVITKSNPVFMY
mmetsp:Transcript_14980/g.17497  ORF Transcript_14980/g.17497 Transcript_14980/m.17497 type:complete len:326 (-) Transcript_14980:141-1118(-)